MLHVLMKVGKTKRLRLSNISTNKIIPQGLYVFLVSLHFHMSSPPYTNAHTDAHIYIYIYIYIYIKSEKDIDTRLTKAWTAIDRLSIIWKSDLIDKMKHSFFQAAVVSILLYGCTTWTLTKKLEKKLDGNYTRML